MRPMRLWYTLASAASNTDDAHAKGSPTAFHCVYRRCGVREVRLTPQDLCALYLNPFRKRQPLVLHALHLNF